MLMGSWVSNLQSSRLCLQGAGVTGAHHHALTVGVCGVIAPCRGPRNLTHKKKPCGGLGSLVSTEEQEPLQQISNPFSALWFPKLNRMVQTALGVGFPQEIHAHQGSGINRTPHSTSRVTGVLSLFKFHLCKRCHFKNCPSFLFLPSPFSLSASPATQHCTPNSLLLLLGTALLALNLLLTESPPAGFHFCPAPCSGMLGLTV